MVDRELLRQKPETIRETLKKRGDDIGLVDRYLEAEQKWLTALKSFESLKAEQNKVSRGGKPSEEELKKAKELKGKLEGQSQKVTELERECRQIWLQIPNTVLPDVPVGEGESANTVVGTYGRIRIPEGRSHEALMTGESVRQASLDLKTAARVSGSRFRYLLNRGAVASLTMLHEAFRFALKKGFTPVVPPVMVRGETMTRSGYFPAFEEDIFKIQEQDLYLVGTSEQTLLGLAGDRVFDVKELPLRLVGYSSCFRKEVGSYGKDVEGMFRQHQFDKVEMVSITTPEHSEAEHDFLVALEEQFVNQWDLPYQKLLIGSGDLGPTAAKKIDIECWFPGQKRYRETHSASNCTDYQARRLNIKVRLPNGEEVFAHTLNATLATERLVLSLVENNQRPDGTFRLPRRLS